MSLAALQGQPTPLFDRFPAFFVVNGAVVHHLGGSIKKLNEGDSVNYRRHGSFKVKRVGNNHGRIEVTLPNGAIHEAVIPACARLTIVEGHRLVESRVPKSEFGFVCPAWAKSRWNERECTVEPATDGTYVLLDHSLNGVRIFVGRSAGEVRDWLADHLE